MPWWDAEWPGNLTKNRATRSGFFSILAHIYIKDFVCEHFEFEFTAIFSHVQHWTVDNFIVDEFHGSEIVFEGMAYQYGFITDDALEEGVKFVVDGIGNWV